MEYAKSLIKNRNKFAENEICEEESWTFIGDDSDPDLQKRMAQWDMHRQRDETEEKVKERESSIDIQRVAATEQQKPRKSLGVGRIGVF